MLLWENINSQLLVCNHGGAIAQSHQRTAGTNAQPRVRLWTLNTASFIPVRFATFNRKATMVPYVALFEKNVKVLCGQLQEIVKDANENRKYR